METQLTALERKIDDLLASVVNAHVPGSEVNDANSDTVGKAAGTNEEQSDQKQGR